VATRRITDNRAAFIAFELESNDARRQKVALQDVSRLYRTSHRFAPEARIRIEQQINGLSTMSNDPKVVRWCMNVLARLGTKASEPCAETVLKRYAHDPEIVASAVSAIAHFRLGNIANFKPLQGISPEVQLLAAMQTVEATRLEKNSIFLDIDNSDAELLKLALIIVGLGKDIENLFHPRHNNGEIVKALAQHDDPIVRQYSAWAVIENSRLSIEHLGIDLNNIELEPPNVQSKVLQLAASSLPDISHRHEIVIRGTDFPSVDAREGLAKGIVYNYYDGLEGVTLDWFDTDGSSRVQLLLAEHFARFSSAIPSYRDKALEIIDINDQFRHRIVMGSEGTQLHADIRKLDNSRSPTFFDAVYDVKRHELLKAVKMKEDCIVLILNATPDDQERIRADKECALLERQLETVKNRERNLIIVQKHAVRLSDIQRELLNNRPKILHFSGHGGPGELIFEGDDGSSQSINAEQLADILRLYGGLDCLILHACYSERVAAACAKHVNFVIGSTDEIDDYTAPKFTYAFYQGLANGRDYMNSFEMGKAEVALSSSAQAALYVAYQRTPPKFDPPQ